MRNTATVTPTYAMPMVHKRPDAAQQDTKADASSGPRPRPNSTAKLLSTARATRSSSENMEVRLTNEKWTTMPVPKPSTARATMSKNAQPGMILPWVTAASSAAKLTKKYNIAPRALQSVAHTRRVCPRFQNLGLT